MKPSTRYVLPATGLITFLLVWEAVSRSGWFETYLLPPPSTVLPALLYGQDRMEFMRSAGLDEDVAVLFILLDPEGSELEQVAYLVRAVKGSSDLE